MALASVAVAPAESFVLLTAVCSNPSQALLISRKSCFEGIKTRTPRNHAKSYKYNPQQSRGTGWPARVLGEKFLPEHMHG